MALQFFPENGAVTNQRWLFQNRLNALGTKINTLLSAAGQAGDSANRWGNLYQYEDSAQTGAKETSFNRLLGSLDSWRQEKAARTAAAAADKGPLGSIFGGAAGGAGAGMAVGGLLAAIPSMGLSIPLSMAAGAGIGAGAGSLMGAGSYYAGGGAPSSQGMMGTGMQFANLYQQGQQQAQQNPQPTFAQSVNMTTPFSPQSVAPAPRMGSAYTLQEPNLYGD